ncbi:hypothetical protein FE257_001066 [Aspergillus nanangensis]|uniref:Uncharacterized protein n=1 Tax=Aspergillus nanangensis TaxID=2582783 RepID=A0AAD4GWE2_ASPNN|nr:hypothetical protein FE257_001066 [Aspergillus nanangensis]
MPNPIDLPPELLAQVLDDALTGSHSQQVCQLMLVNSQWRAVIQPRVYSKWTYDGAIQSFASLWSFLLAVLRNPQLADLVRTLHIGNWGFNPYITLDEEFDHPLHDWDLVSQALHRAGLGSLEPRIQQELSQGDRRPIMALLLTCLPNVTAINAHVPPSDPVLGIVLERIFLQQSENPSSVMLPSLTHVQLRSEIPPEMEQKDTPLQLTNVWPIMLLPTIRSLSILQLDAEGASTLLEDKKSPNLHHLTLVSSRTSKGVAGDIEAILAVPETLRSLSLFLNDWEGTLWRHPVLLLSNPDLWNALKKHQQSLEYLDIYRSSQADDELEHRLECLGPLHSFSKLRDLYIHPEVLLGGCSKSPNSSILLQDTLPPNLQSLTLYGYEGLLYISDLSTQIEDTLNSGKFRTLQTLNIEQTSCAVIGPGCVPEPLQEILQRTNTTISFKKQCIHTVGVPPHCDLPIGGSCERLWQATDAMRTSGKQRKEKVQAYFERLEDSDYDPGDETFSRAPKRMIPHTLPFTDHAGQPALMIFDWYEGYATLPPLFSFAFYFTHADAGPESMPWNEFCTDIGASHPGNYDTRFDCYFLPGASHIACMHHYRAELVSRGTLRDQIGEYRRRRRDALPPPSAPGKLPGVVDAYYEGIRVLFICAHPSWKTGQRTMWIVEFDPHGEEDWSAHPDGDEAEGEAAENHQDIDDGTGEGEGHAITNPPDHDGAHSVRMCTMDKDHALYDQVEGGTVSERLWEYRHSRRDELSYLWQRAIVRGWRNW